MCILYFFRLCNVQDRDNDKRRQRFSMTAENDAIFHVWTVICHFTVKSQYNVILAIVGVARINGYHIQFSALHKHFSISIFLPFNFNIPIGTNGESLDLLTSLPSELFESSLCSSNIDLSAIFWNFRKI